MTSDSKPDESTEQPSEAVHPEDQSAPEIQRNGGGPPPLVVSSVTDAPNPKNNRRPNTPPWEKVAVIIAGGLLVVNIFAMCAAKSAANAAKSAADTASRQLEMIDRPWIKISVRSWVDFTFQNGNISWGVVVRTQNIGHSVATAIYPRAKLIVASTYSIDEPRMQAEKFCAEVTHTFESVKNNPSVWGDSIFPGDYLEFPANLVVIPSDVKNASFDGGSSLGNSLIPMLIGCVEYHYPSSDKPHRTQFVYGLSHIDDPAVPEAARVFFSIGKTIPRDKMQLFEQSVFAD